MRRVIPICLLIYAAGVSLVPRHGFVTVDLGAIHLQVHRLATAGSPDLPVGPLLEPVLREYFPWRYESTPPGAIADFAVLRGGWIVEREGRFLVLYPIAYAACAAVAQRVLGEHGPLLLSILAALIAVLATVRLAANLGIEHAPSAGALLGVATPLALYAVLVWGHAPATAGAALGWLALTPPATSPLTQRRALSGGLAFGLCGAFRNEGLLLAALVAVAVAAFSPHRRTVVSYAAGVALALAPTLAYNRAAFGSFLDPTQGSRAAAMAPSSSAPSPAAPSRIVRAVATARESLFGADNLKPAGQVVLAVSLAALTLGLALALHTGSRALARVGLLLLTALSGLYLLFALGVHPQQIPGLLVCSPALLPGLAALLCPRVWGGHAQLRTSCAAALAFVAITMLRGSPGWQWGGRYLLPVTPLLAALSVLALERIASSGFRLARLHRTSLIALGVAFSLIAYRDVGGEQRYHEEHEQATVRGWNVNAVAFDHWWFSWENAPLAVDHELFFAADPAPLLGYLSTRHVERVAWFTRAKELPGAPPGWQVSEKRTRTLSNGRPWAAVLFTRR